MSRTALLSVVLAGMCAFTVMADEPVQSPLQFFEKMVGEWEVKGKSADGTKTEGRERVEWIFNKNALKGTGWWQQEGDEKMEYEYFLVWNEATKGTDMHIVGSDGGSALRCGFIDMEKGVWRNWHKGVTGDGESLGWIVEVHFADDGKSFAWKGTGHMDGVPAPLITATFTRVE
jgi:hypothetical protein